MKNIAHFAESSHYIDEFDEPYVPLSRHIPKLMNKEPFSTKDYLPRACQE
jgi:hypothetical protein